MEVELFCRGRSSRLIWDRKNGADESARSWVRAFSNRTKHGIEYTEWNVEFRPVDACFTTMCTRDLWRCFAFNWQAEYKLSTITVRLGAIFQMMFVGEIESRRSLVKIYYLKRRLTKMISFRYFQRTWPLLAVAQYCKISSAPHLSAPGSPVVLVARTIGF